MARMRRRGSHAAAQRAPQKGSRVRTVPVIPGRPVPPVAETPDTPVPPASGPPASAPPASAPPASAPPASAPPVSGPPPVILARRLRPRVTQPRRIAVGLAAAPPAGESGRRAVASRPRLRRVRLPGQRPLSRSFRPSGLVALPVAPAPVAPAPAPGPVAPAVARDGAARNPSYAESRRPGPACRPQRLRRGRPAHGPSAVPVAPSVPAASRVPASAPLDLRVPPSAPLDTAGPAVRSAGSAGAAIRSAGSPTRPPRLASAWRRAGTAVAGGPDAVRAEPCPPRRARPAVPGRGLRASITPKRAIAGVVRRRRPGPGAGQREIAGSVRGAHRARFPARLGAGAVRDGGLADHRQPGRRDHRTAHRVSAAGRGQHHPQHGPDYPARRHRRGAVSMPRSISAGAGRRGSIRASSPCTGRVRPGRSAGIRA